VNNLPFIYQLFNVTDFSGFLIGGEDAKRGSYPFVAALGVKDNFGRTVWACGGALINRRYVVTAAHCHSDKSPIAAVLLGEHDFESDPDCPSCRPVQRFDIRSQDVTVHERFFMINFYFVYNKFPNITFVHFSIVH
jgi:hypothetical protein